MDSRHIVPPRSRQQQPPHMPQVIRERFFHPGKLHRFIFSEKNEIPEYSHNGLTAPSARRSVQADSSSWLATPLEEECQ